MPFSKTRKLAKHSSGATAANKVPVSSLDAEIHMVILTWALARWLLARQTFDPADPKPANAHLHQAYSLLAYLTQPDTLMLPASPHLELSAPFVHSLLFAIHGSMHLLVLYKSLVLPNTYSSHLVSTSISPPLLATIATFAAQSFVSASSTLSPDLSEWTADAAAYSNAYAHMCLALAAYKQRKVGDAIARLNAANETLKGISSSSHLKQPISALGTQITQLLNAYSAENSSISFQQVPSTESILPMLPSGRVAVIAPAPWQPPAVNAATGQHTATTDYY
ncbi:hypothetical protein CANCADRAFT_45293 [Tortispora caseinolytica NRRL Y-17796]|uniref:pH-response regulator protein palC n=1 Tax=Tortispora caseinolytica NRRL Y-17796 TaxID=767744 RepID=A0A1E4TAS4_9ASCO|nr:hypothetical protein CANCADRAFT_45293 [Tortispora caseinolytica NRRL Y-17796]